MVAAELTSGSKYQMLPNAGKKMIWVQGTAAANNDFITVTGLSVVEGAYLIATDGTVGAMTFSTNVITITNAGTKTFSGFAWGY